MEIDLEFYRPDHSDIKSVVDALVKIYDDNKGEFLKKYGVNLGRLLTTKIARDEKDDLNAQYRELCEKIVKLDPSGAAYEITLKYLRDIDNELAEVGYDAPGPGYPERYTRKELREIEQSIWGNAIASSAEMPKEKRVEAIPAQ